MREEYKGCCMKFSNEELKKYMVDYLIDNSWDCMQIRFLSEDGDDIELDSSEEIETIVLDGTDENLCIMFFDCQTSVFVYNEEIMFIDDNAKGSYTSSDVYGNAVYEGKLREMSHEEMLHLFSEVILCFADATDVSITQSVAPENKYKKYWYYTPHLFTVHVKKKGKAEQISVYENITIVH